MTSNQNLVSASWLAQNLDAPDVVIVDCRFQLSDPQWGHQQYLISHLPGAYYLDLNQDLSSPVHKHGGRHPLPDSATLAAKLATMGVEFGKTLVVAYDDSRFAFGARLWWLLRYFGHSQVALLDGGWSNWLTQEYPITSAIPPQKTSHFVPQLQSDWIVDIETLKAQQNLPEVLLVDSRANNRYRGEIEPIDPIAGHIPSAINLPWQEVTDADGFSVPLSLHQKRWQQLPNHQELILYCGSGVTACVNLLSLSLADISGAKLYVGGWSDWCSYL